MIPQGRYSQRSADRLMEYLTVEQRRAESARQPLERRWMKYHEAYKAEPIETKNDFPFRNSSNLVIPLIATDVDTIFSRLMGMYFGQENLWTCRATRPDMVDFAPRLEEFLAWAQEVELKVYDPIADWLLETVKLGTGVLKTRYVRDWRKVYEFREVGDAMGNVQTLERQARILISDHPEVSHVSLWNFFVPPGYAELKSAPWCSERIYLTDPQLYNRAKNGIYMNTDRLAGWARSAGSMIDLNLDRMDSFRVQQGDKYDLREFWLDWDIDEDGEDEAVVCTVHMDTKTYLRLDFNPFFNQEKPYDFSRYLRSEKRFYGIGVAEMLSQFQDEVSTMHNQRIDSYSVANAAIFVALKTGNIKQDEPLFPGRILLVDNLDEIKPLQLGSPIGMDINQEQLSVSYARQRTGVNDWVSGSDSFGNANNSTATVAVQQLREGSKRIDQTLRENRRCLGSVGQKVVELYQQFWPGGKPWMAMGPKDGAMVMQILQFPTEIIRAGVAIDVSAASASHNRETELRTNILIMQQVTQYYMQLIQAMQLAVTPAIPPQIQKIAYDAAVGGSTLMRRILDLYQVQDVDAIVPDIQQALAYGQSQLDTLSNALGGGAPAGPGIGGPSGVSPVLGGSQGAAIGAGAGMSGGLGFGSHPQVPGSIPGY